MIRARLKVTRAITAAVLILIVGVAVCLGQAAPTSTWSALESALKQCQAALQKASPANQGGYVEKAIVDVNRAIADVASAAADASPSPAVDALPLAGSAAAAVIAASIQFEIDGIGRSNGRDISADMVAAQRALRAAASEIQKIPANAKGRDLVIRDIGKLASDFTSAKSVLNGTAAAASRPGVVNITADTSTTSASLRAMQTTLKEAIDSLRKEGGDAHGGFVEKAIGDANQALSDVAKALEFVKSHPTVDVLAAPAASGASPMVSIRTLYYGRKALADAGVSTNALGAPPQPNRTTPAPNPPRYPNLSDGLFYFVTAMDAALHEFLNGPDNAEMDGYNNAIMADLARGIANIISAIAYVPGR